MKGIAVAALMLGACAFAVAKPIPSARQVPSAKRGVPAKDVPLPRPKLVSLSPAAQVPTGDAEAEPSACVQRLQEFARFTARPSKDGPGECDIGDVIELERIVMPDGSLVAVNPVATLACPMAEAVVHWMRNDIAPATAKLAAPPAAIVTQGSYDCRGRNGIRGAKMSEHGRGNAIDVGAIKLSNGEVLALTDGAAPKPFRQYVRAAACERFTTVLGPGSDRYHESHVHLDLAERTGGHRLCQWDVREPAVAAAPAPELSSAKRQQPQWRKRRFRR
jgi:hypothetical protein